MTSENGPSFEAQRIAEYLLTHVGGDESQPWQAGHNYAMREAARLVGSQEHLLDYGINMPCPDCGGWGPHERESNGRRVECAGCGGSWNIDQRGVFTQQAAS